MLLPSRYQSRHRRVNPRFLPLLKWKSKGKECSFLMMFSLLLGFVPSYVQADTTVQFYKTTYDVKESEGSVTLWVERKGGSGPVKVKYGTVSGSAMANIDYVPTEGILEFGEPTTTPYTKPFTINLINDAVSEDPQKELFYVALTDSVGNPNSVAFNKNFIAQVYIHDDDISTIVSTTPPPSDTDTTQPTTGDEETEDTTTSPIDTVGNIVPDGQIQPGGIVSFGTQKVSIFSYQTIKFKKTGVQVVYRTSFRSSFFVSLKRSGKDDDEVMTMDSASEAFFTELLAGLEDRGCYDILLATDGNMLIQCQDSQGVPYQLSAHAGESSISIEEPGLYLPSEGGMPRVVFSYLDDQTGQSVTEQAEVYPEFVPEILSSAWDEGFIEELEYLEGGEVMVKLTGKDTPATVLPGWSVVNDNSDIFEYEINGSWVTSSANGLSQNAQFQ